MPFPTPGARDSGGLSSAVPAGAAAAASSASVGLARLGEVPLIQLLDCHTFFYISCCVPSPHWIASHWCNSWCLVPPHGETSWTFCHWLNSRAVTSCHKARLSAADISLLQSSCSMSYSHSSSMMTNASSSSSVSDSDRTELLPASTHCLLRAWSASQQGKGLCGCELGFALSSSVPDVWCRGVLGAAPC